MAAASGWGGAARFVLHVQGWVYVTTGLWPVVHLAGFEHLTGRLFDSSTTSSPSGPLSYNCVRGPPGNR